MTRTERGREKMLRPPATEDWHKILAPDGPGGPVYVFGLAKVAVKKFAPRHFDRDEAFGMALEVMVRCARRYEPGKLVGRTGRPAKFASYFLWSYRLYMRRVFAERSDPRRSPEADGLKVYSLTRHVQTRYRGHHLKFDYEQVDPKAVDPAVAAERDAEFVEMLRHLPKRHRDLLDLLFGLSDGVARSFTAVARLWGVSRERIRQLYTHARNKLRERFPHVVNGFDVSNPR